jgi:mRNA-degrading endonuclease RelE of RelBE toxin-antitoxin system
LTFLVKVRNTATHFINSVPEKSQRIITTALLGLEENPFPGSGGNKERMVMKGGRELYRIHIARMFTAFYTIDIECRVVRVHEILTIEQAHKKYGRL